MESSGLMPSWVVHGPQCFWQITQSPEVHGSPAGTWDRWCPGQPVAQDTVTQASVSGRDMELSPGSSNRMPSGAGGGTTHGQSLWEGTRTSLSPFTVLSAFATTFYGKKKKKPRHVFPKYPPHFPSALLPTEAMTPSTTTWLAWSCSAGALEILQTPSNTQTSDRAPKAAESPVRAGSLPGSAGPATRRRVPPSSYCYGQTFPLGFKLLAAHGSC